MYVCLCVNLHLSTFPIRILFVLLGLICSYGSSERRWLLSFVFYEVMMMIRNPPNDSPGVL